MNSNSIQYNMKTNKTILTATLALGLLVSTVAYSQPVDSVLAQTYSMFQNAQSYPQLLMASNRFKLIAAHYPLSWLADYYAAWSIAVLSFRTPDKKTRDPMLDQADAYFQKIERLDTSNDEVAVLGALLAQARLSVSPASRHGKYGAIANTYLALAKKINPDNPRIYYLKGNALFYTPKLFGGGAEKALPLYEKAEPLFVKDSHEINKPHWGKKETGMMMQQCRKKLGK